MAAPAYVNAGTRTNISSVTGETQATPALPASLVNGNILIAVAMPKAAQDTLSCSTSGWTAIGQDGQGTGSSGIRMGLWWRRVDGTETAPTITWTLDTGGAAQVFQFSRENFDYGSGAVIGTVGSFSKSLSSTHTSTGFNTTKNNSLVVNMGVVDTSTGSYAIPSGWNERVDNGSSTGTTRNVVDDKTVTTSGTSSGNISISGPNGDWLMIQFEIKEPTISGTMAPTESGSDTAAMSGTVAVSGTLAATESGSDTFAGTGTVTDAEVTGTMAAQETGDDTFAGSGTVAVTGALDATEIGDDTFSGSGQVAVSGSLDATEVGDDTFAGTGSVEVSGTLAAQEVGDDTFEGTGQVLITGSLAAQEAGEDTFAGTGTVTDAGGPVTGSMAAVETGDDTFAGEGVVLVTGTMDAAEAGDDVFAAEGTVTDAGSTITGTMAAIESGIDIFYASANADVSGGRSRGGISFTLPAGTKRKKPKSMNSQLEEAVRRALGRFPGKRSKPTITSERLTAAAEAILNADSLPEWEYKRVGDILSDIIGDPIRKAANSRIELGRKLLELADDASIDEDDEELAELLIANEIEYIMSL